MPTIIAKHDTFNRSNGRWMHFRDVEAADSVSTHAALCGAVALAALVICVACLASGVHPATVNATDLASLLSP
jgi:hypothetical protein